VVNREYLKGNEPFDSLLQELEAAVAASDEHSVRFRIEPTDGKYGGNDVLLKRLRCRRASWAIRLDSVLLDKFFNGLMGIRAQYYASPYHGAAMNSRLLSALRTRLVEIAQSADRKFAELSVDAPSAKVWISEKTLNGQKVIRASDLSLTEEEIQNDWLDLARSVKAGDIGKDQFQLYSAAFNGVRAPIADQLEVKGAWITSEDRRDYVTPDKRDRDTQVFMFGFT
jgi:hypothetical protein